jgi:hypothetical protein
VADQRAVQRIARDAPAVRPREPQPDVCEHGRPDHQVMIRQLAEAMGLDLPAIAATPAQVWEALLGEVERAARRVEDFHSSRTERVGELHPESAGSAAREVVIEALVELVSWSQGEDVDEWEPWADSVLRALRRLPVEQRMEAMGMVERRASFDGQTFKRCWTEDYS